MGKIGKLFGGSKTQKTSGTSTTSSASGNFLEQLLGVGGDPAAGFSGYLKNAGFGNAMSQGLEDIDAGAAARGLLRSGSTLKAYGNYTSDLRNQYYNDYIGNILGLGGIQNTTTETGKTTASKKPGLGKLIGTAASVAAASDRRLKNNIFKVGGLKNGLNVYQYRYVDGSGPFIGVMADEVEKVMPEALGPEINGYQTVDYSKIKEVI